MWCEERNGAQAFSACFEVIMRINKESVIGCFLSMMLLKLFIVEVELR